MGDLREIPPSLPQVGKNHWFSLFSLEKRSLGQTWGNYKPSGKKSERIPRHETREVTASSGLALIKAETSLLFELTFPADRKDFFFFSPSWTRFARK